MRKLQERANGSRLLIGCIFQRRLLIAKRPTPFFTKAEQGDGVHSYPLPLPLVLNATRFCALADTLLRRETPYAPFFAA